MDYKDVRLVNGKEVISKGIAGETKRVEDEFYGYAYFETEDGIYYVPVKGQNIILSKNIWKFINELPKIN